MKIIVKLGLGFGERERIYFVREVFENKKILVSGCTPKEGGTTLYLMLFVRFLMLLSYY